MADVKWTISGDYFENCSCDYHLPLSCFDGCSDDLEADTGRL